MPRWHTIDLGNKLFENVDQSALTEATAAQENFFITESGSHSRFPGLIQRVTLPDNGRCYLSKLDNDLIAATTKGRVYRIDSEMAHTDVTGVPITGGRPIIFSPTENELIMAAGGPMIRLRDIETELHAEDTENTTHVVFIDGYVIYIEHDSPRWYHSKAGATRNFPPLNVFTAESKPDSINNVSISPFRELLVCGEDSVEQWERLPEGTQPFGRRWTTGEGLKFPYTLVFADNATFGVNEADEIVRFSGQVSAPISGDIAASVEGLDDKSDAFGLHIQIKGQDFLIWQFPNATSGYTTKGVTFAYDVRNRRWLRLYGWDSKKGVPDRWPVWSYQKMWGRHFVGTTGGVAELSTSTYTNLGQPQRLLYRSAPLSDWGESTIEDLEIRFKRGVVGSNDTAPKIRVRMIKDEYKPTRWIERSLGLAGDREPMIRFGAFGHADTWQLEYLIDADAQVEIVGVRALVEVIGDG